jgi:hypothetical protein
MHQGDWPFEYSPETLCITTPEVLEGSSDILRAWPDDEFGPAWAFMPSESPERVSGATLRAMLELDATLADIGPVPIGWYAHRERRGSLWQKSPIPPEEGKQARPPR